MNKKYIREIENCEDCSYILKHYLYEENGFENKYYCIKSKRIIPDISIIDCNCPLENFFRNNPNNHKRVKKLIKEQAVRNDLTIDEKCDNIVLELAKYIFDKEIPK